MAQVEETTSVVDWVSAGATIAATLVALALGLGLIEWFRRPKLKLEHSPDVPSDRVVTLAIGGGIAAYLRARVSNGGKKSAKNVTVSVLSIEDWMSNTRR